jgi:hypothetical protein
MVCWAVVPTPRPARIHAKHDTGGSASGWIEPADSTRVVRYERRDLGGHTYAGQTDLRPCHSSSRSSLSCWPPTSASRLRLTRTQGFGTIGIWLATLRAVIIPLPGCRIRIARGHDVCPRPPSISKQILPRLLRDFLPPGPISRPGPLSTSDRSFGGLSTEYSKCTQSTPTGDWTTGKHDW